MTSAEILTNQNMEDPLIPASMSWSSESSSFDLYTCRLCSRAFPTTQALGGHQTAHRKEKIERLIRIQRQAEIDELKYAADNDLLLSPEPISWAPPATDDKTLKVSNFMPMGNGTSPVPGSSLESVQGLGMGSSGCSKNKASDDSDQKKQKKRKTIKLSECLENMASDADQKKQKKRKTTKLSEFSEINKASDADKKKQKKRKSTKSSEFSEIVLF